VDVKRGTQIEFMNRLKKWDRLVRYNKSSVKRDVGMRGDRLRDTDRFRV